MSDSKKDSLNKKINIKNKKEATKALSKKKNNVTKAKKSSSSNTKNNKKKKVPNIKTIETTNVKKVETKKKQTKKVVKNEEKTKLVLPKEWQVQKQTKKKTTIQQEPAENLTGILKNSIFEEISEEELIRSKKEKQKKNKKRVIKTIITLLMILVVLFIIVKYKDLMEKSLTVYNEYEIGQTVTLADNSVWYVVSYSDMSTSTVKLLKATQIDINKDGKYDKNDKMKYNSSNKVSYDINDKDSLAYYLENEYKSELAEKIGTISEIGILTTKEFVKIREKMGFDYEWYEANWLANSELDTWWIDSLQTEKAYVVTKIGSYKIYAPNNFNYVRPVITLEKDIIEKKD